jgi:protein pelota
MRVLATEPGKASLGFVETLNALRMGAVEKVLVSEDFLWSKHMDKNVWELIDGAEAFGASVRVISTGSEAADKLNGLGGVAAFLRYPVDPTVLRRVD